MATRSTITMKRNDGTFAQTYCHSDGQPDYNGRILMEYYNNPVRLAKLIALGDLSILGPELGPPEGKDHSFYAPIRGICVAYGRDRGESGVAAQIYLDEEDFLTHRSHEEYDYLFADGVWWVNGKLLASVLQP
jgi:hypothetical protein